MINGKKAWQQAIFASQGGLIPIPQLLAKLASIRGSGNFITDSKSYANAFFNSNGIDTSLSQNEQYNATDDRWEATLSSRLTAPAYNNYTYVYNNCNVRNIIPSSAITGTSRFIRLRLRAYSATQVEYNGITVQRAGSGASFAATPIQVTIGGNTSYILPANNEIYTDIVDLGSAIFGGADFMTAFHIGNVNNTSPSINPIPSGYSNYTKVGASEITTQNVSGYSLNAYNYQFTGLVRIEAIDNLDLITTAITAAAIPAKANIVAVYNPLDAAVLNTNVIARVSSNNGTNYTDIPLTLGGSATGYGFPSGCVYAYGEADITHASPNTQVRGRLLNANNVNIPDYGIAFSIK